MIKILFFIDKLSYNGFIGGAEKVLINLVNALDANKYQIVVQTVFPDPFSHLLHKNIRYKYCFKKKNQVTELLYRMELAAGLLYKKRIKAAYDIETAYLEFESTKAIAASANRTGKKIAWVHCDFEAAIQNKESFVSKAAKQYEKYDKIVCVSSECKESFLKLFSADEKTVILHNVLAADEILKKAEEPIMVCKREDLPVICSVGRFSKPKNHIRLLKTAKELHEEGYQFSIWLVGDGDLRQGIEEYIALHDMNQYVFILGFQKNPYPYMKMADLLVCHSDFEGYSTIAQEAMILQKEFITTECSGMHEILDGYGSGKIVSNNDDSFRDGLREWLKGYRHTDLSIDDLSEKGRSFQEDAIAAHDLLFESLIER